MLGQVKVINFGTPFWSLSVATNVLCTIIIAGRLMYRRRALNPLRDQGDVHKLHEVTSATAIFAESAGLYAICALIYIPLFAENMALQYPFSALLGSVVVGLHTKSCVTSF